MNSELENRSAETLCVGWCKVCKSYQFSNEDKTLRYNTYRAKPAKTKFVYREHERSPISQTPFCSSIYSNPLRLYPCCVTNRKVAGSIPADVSGFFIGIKSFRSHYGTGVESASNRNEYHEYFLGGKGGRCTRLTTYHHPVPLSRNQGALISWNPLGLSRPVMGLL